MNEKSENRVPADHARINVNNEAELRYWTEWFTTTPDEVRKAVAAVGVSVTDVKIYLGK